MAQLLRVAGVLFLIVFNREQGEQIEEQPTLQGQLLGKVIQGPHTDFFSRIQSQGHAWLKASLGNSVVIPSGCVTGCELGLYRKRSRSELMGWEGT